MLQKLFPNWKNLTIVRYSLPLVALEDFFLKPFILRYQKSAPSHIILVLSSIENLKPLYFLKAFCTRPFRRNRLKAFLYTYKNISEKEIPLLKPLFVFYESQIIAYLKKRIFYGGILFPYIEKGFLSKELLFQENFINLLVKLVKFIFEIHEKGILLGDTKYNNFYYDEKEGFKLFDLDGIKFLERKPSKEERLKDLSSLTMTLEWDGLKKARDLIFDTYATLMKNISPHDKDFYLYCIEKKRQKRLKKLKNTYFVNTK